MAADFSSSTKSRVIVDTESSPSTSNLPEQYAARSTNKTNGGGNRRKTAQAVVYILGWYLFSLSISIYNKWMFGNGLDFKFPIIITSFHQMCLFALSSLVLYLNPQLRPSTLVLDPSLSGASGASPAAANAVSVPATTTESSQLVPKFSQLFKIKFSTYVKQIFPCSIASAGDIGISNVSIMFVTLSLYTMLKTSSLIFVLIFGLLFKLEKFNWRLIVIVGIMFGSVIMMVKKPEDEDFDDSMDSGDVDNGADDSLFGYDPYKSHNHIVGSTLVILAAMMSGLRWSFTQMLLKNNPRTPNSITTIFYLSPAMCVLLFTIGMFHEGWGNFLASNIWEVKGVFVTIALMIIPGFLAFMMTLCEFKLLSVSQVITLSIAGIFKELLTIILSSIIFGDRLSFINVLGLVITFLDILWYNWFRYNQNTKYVAVDQIEMRKL